MSTLVVGLAWGIWHVPLYGPAGFVIPLILAFFYTWLYNRTGSILICLLLHASFTPAQNFLTFARPPGAVTPGIADQADLVILSVYILAALGLTLATRGRLGLSAADTDRRLQARGTSAQTPPRPALPPTGAPSPRNHRAGRVALIVGASVVGVSAAGLTVVLAVGGIFVPATYLQPWAATYHQQFTDPRMQVVAHAVLAPSGHNMQPWTIRLDETDDDALYLYADPTRLTPAVDPLARQTLVTQGAFLAYLDVAAAHLGYRTSIELFPNGAYDEDLLEQSMSAVPVARVTLSEDPSASTDDYAALFMSDTNRSPYTAAPLTDDEITALLALEDAPTTTLELFSDGQDIATLGELAVEGTLIETEYLAATEESNAVFHSTEQAKNDARSGFAVEGQGTSGFMKYLLQGAITLVPSLNDDAAAAKNAIAMTASGVDHTAAYVLISTEGNTRTEQVEAGMLYAHLSLRARTLGLVMQPLSQALQEYPPMAAPYAAIHSEYAPGGSTIQMMIRIGTATTDYPTTMRRDANDLVHTP